MNRTSLKFVLSAWLAYCHSAVTGEKQSSNVGVVTAADGDEIVFLNFVSYFDSKLRIPINISKMVATAEECQYLCLGTAKCLSVNVKRADSNGLHLYELLSATKDSESDKFEPRETFHHFSTIVSAFFS